MDITSLPTENLWKFLAFAGLLILTVIPGYLYKLYMQVYQKLIDCETELEILDKRLDNESKIIDKQEKQEDHNIQYLERLKSQVDIELNSNTAGSYLDLQNKIHSYRNELTTSYIKTKERLLEISISNIRVKGNHKLVKILHAQAKILKKITIAAIIAGLFMTITGFYKWYNIQKLVDNDILKGMSK